MKKWMIKLTMWQSSQLEELESLIIRIKIPLVKIDKTDKFRNTLRINKMSKKTTKTKIKTIKTKMKTNKMSNFNKGWKSNELLQSKCQIKTKKCQPAARDTTDLIQTDGVPDSGLSRPKIKKTQKQK